MHADETHPLSSEEQLTEIAKILAHGILRLRSRAAVPTKPDDPHAQENLSKSSDSEVDVRANSGITVTQVNDSRDSKTEEHL
ncbi:MAG: hypothetical protein ACFCD0_12985 [Gemmataceae bacterium]